eukprot:UN08361
MFIELESNRSKFKVVQLSLEITSFNLPSTRSRKRFKTS